MEENSREIYLEKFERNNDVSKFGFSKEASQVGQKIVDELKKGDLTYDEAYASLQWAYNKIRYESNFVTLK